MDEVGRFIDKTIGDPVFPQIHSQATELKEMGRVDDHGGDYDAALDLIQSLIGDRT